jgi:hypothetical protein
MPINAPTTPVARLETLSLQRHHKSLQNGDQILLGPDQVGVHGLVRQIRIPGLDRIDDDPVLLG